MQAIPLGVKGNLMSSNSLERAKIAQGRVEEAVKAAAKYNAEIVKRRQRFIDLLRETIEDDPQQIRSDGWLCHHAINTLEMSCQEIADKCGITKDELIAEWNKTATV